MPTTNTLDDAVDDVVTMLKRVFHDELKDIDPRDCVRPQFGILCRANPNTGEPFERPSLVIFLPSHFDNEDDKDIIAATIRLIAVAGDAAAVVVCLDSWILIGEAGREAYEQGISATNHPQRREAMACTIERIDRGATIEHHVYRRTSDGEIVWQDSERMPEGVAMEGRFANLLPPSRPTPRERGAARMLVAMGAAGKLTWTEVK